MNINEIINRAYVHAEKIGAYDCEFCKSCGIVVWNMDDQKIEAVTKMQAPCPDCHGTGKTASKNIIAKLCEEIGELETAIRNNAIVSNEEMKWLKTWRMHPDWFESEIKNTIGDELADIIITALAGSKELGIDIESHIMAKLRYNEIREDHK